MRSESCHENLIVDTNVTEFFHGLVASAAGNQGLDAAAGTLHYVVNLLTTFTHADALYEPTPDGPMIKPLALLYADAVDAPSIEARNRALQRLGDLALFISGIFPDSLNRKLVDVDYYIAMGGGAYGYLSGRGQDLARWRVLSDTFDELAAKFTAFVDLLGEVGEQAHFRNDSDIMRLYEVWLRTGSERSARRLRSLGIQPLTGSVTRTRH